VGVKGGRPRPCPVNAACPPLKIKNGGKMKFLKFYIAVIVFSAMAAFTSCKKDNGVVPVKTHQTVVMDSGGQNDPTPPPPPPPPNP
jgi:hypothetical protein